MEGGASISEAEPGETVYVNVWAGNLDKLVAVYMNGQEIDPVMEGYTTYSFTMPEQEAVITIEWAEEAPAEGFPISWVPEEDAPADAEVTFYSDFGETEITHAKPGDVIYISVSGSAQPRSVSVNGEVAVELTGYYYYEIPSTASEIVVTMVWGVSIG